MKLTFDRSEYLCNSDVFETDKLDEVDSELCEFGDDIDDIAYELAYTRYELAKKEAEILNMEEGLRRLDDMFWNKHPYSLHKEPTLSQHLAKLLTEGK